MSSNDTICAPITGDGVGAVKIIRISGDKAFVILKKIFVSKNNSYNKKIIANRVYYGKIINPETKKILDNVLVSFFKSPHSYTGEDVAEINIHGSVYIQNQLINILIGQGCRLANPGEFSQRAFFNQKFDLAQAEAVADVIAGTTETEHRIAMNQMRGGYSKKLEKIRADLIKIVSLMELELDFSEEDVEFADRRQLLELVVDSEKVIKNLAQTFEYGNSIKNGVPIAIVGEPNTGKSTLLNQLLQDEKAIVSDIPGTTRDAIEDTVVWHGVTYRFIDTAGLRNTTDTIESLGIEVTKQHIQKSHIVLLMFDAEKNTINDIKIQIDQFKKDYNCTKKVLIPILNKIDKQFEKQLSILKNDLVYISAKYGNGVEELKTHIHNSYNEQYTFEGDSVVVNMRHYAILNKISSVLQEVYHGLNTELTTDLIAIDMHTAIELIGQITGGSIVSEDILDSIFNNFCIGK